MAAPDSSREDLAASVAARRALGPDYEDAVLDGFLERVEQTITARVDARLDQQKLPKAGRQLAPVDRGTSIRSFVLGIVSLVAGIPVTAITVTQAGLPEVLVSWAGIAGVNFAHSWANRRS